MFILEKMSGVASEWCRWRLLAAVFIGLLLTAASISVSAQEARSENKNEKFELNNVMKVSKTLERRSGYKHVWPVSSLSFLCVYLQYI